MNNHYRKEIKNNSDYLRFLSLMGSLSNLFAESDIPFIHYRVTENLFCKCFGAENLARFDDSYDAKKWDAGIGIKTFILPSNGATAQKVAEFDSLAPLLTGLNVEDAAKMVSGWRNQRIETADATHAITGRSIYHIIGRMKGMLKLFVVDYDKIQIDSVRVINQTSAGFTFTDGLHDYNFNKSKSTLLERFVLPPEDQVITVPVDIDTDPFETLKRLLDNPVGRNVVQLRNDYSEQRGVRLEAIRRNNNEHDSVVLPLFSTRERGAVPLKSGLNQWNADGRPRDPNEVYIPVPALIHEKNPTFFPERNVSFVLKLPNGSHLSAKMCQDGRKGLMSNPNKALGKWLLRDVLRIPEGKIVTREMLDISGFDSLIIIKESDGVYRLQLSREAHYRDYTPAIEED